jgi:bifunctional non-homologous end joining protein LigD
MLATAADPDHGLPRDAERWAYEVKWDGMRVLVDVREGVARLWSRTERDVTVAFPELAGLSAVRRDLLVDGEIVVLSGGVPSFATLANRFHVTDPRQAAQLANRSPATLIAFDLLRVDGVDVTDRPWQERRQLLEALGAQETWQLSPVQDDLEALLAATVEHNLEGVVAKRRASRYHPNSRSRDWIKLAHKHNQVAVVGGWRPETNDPHRIGALLLGIYRPSTSGDDEELQFAGRVGSGLVAAGPQADLQRLLAPLTVKRSPFADAVPRIDARGTTWVEPSVVVEVRHLGHTEGGRLRQPVFRGLRADVEPESVHDE